MSVSIDLAVLYEGLRAAPGLDTFSESSRRQPMVCKMRPISELSPEPDAVPTVRSPKAGLRPVLIGDTWGDHVCRCWKRDERLGWNCSHGTSFAHGGPAPRQVCLHTILLARISPAI